MKKRMLTMLLALVMIMAVLPFSAMAAEKKCTHSSKYGTRTESVASDCINRGAVYIFCKKCGEIKTTTYKELAPHNYGADSKCTVCGTVCSKHTYGEKETDPATCTKDGSVTQTCTKCKYKKTVKTLKSEGHKFTVSVKGLAATCTVDGYTPHKICSVCGEKNSEYAVIKAKGHDLKTLEDKAATCTVDGVLKQKCKRDGCNYENTEIREATGHSRVEIPAKAPTCTEAGYSAHKKCTVCGSETGKTTFAATSHTYVNGQCACGTPAPDYTGSSKPIKNCKHPSKSTYKTSADCTVVGYVVVTCDTCHVEISREIIEATGHTTKTYVQNPTCTQDGFVKEICTICKTQVSCIAQEALGHNYVNGICTYCGGADQNKYTYDFQDVFLTAEG